MKRLTFCLILAFAAFAPFAHAGKVIKGAIPGGQYGVVIEAAFPNTPKLDGDLDELVWNYAPWHVVGAKDGTVPADSDKDASVAFAVAADDQFLYVAAKVTDDAIVSNEDVGCDVWKDDSVELYVDMGNEKANSYDANDAQITVGADFIGVKADAALAVDLLGGCVGITQGPATGTMATATETANGWNVEIAIPLANDGWTVKLKDGLVIGFNLHYNDDDDKGDRDSKLIWSEQEVQLGEASWRDPSRFAELKFVEATLDVDAAGRLATVWGALKGAR